MPVGTNDRDVCAALSTAILLAVLFVACDKNPGRPTPVPGVPSVVRLELAGPGSIAPSAAEQFRATAHMSDGSQRDVTAEAAWSSANGSIVSVSSGGLATAHERGETDIRAAVSQSISTKVVMVLPPGTFKVSGQVLDEHFSVTDARVEVTAGSATGLSTLSQRGHYALYGVSGPTEIRAAKEGYQPRVETLDVIGHRILDIPLIFLRPPWDPSGSTSSRLPPRPSAWLRCRKTHECALYRASLQLLPNSRYVSVTLEGDNFESLNHWFWRGSIGETSVLFEYVNYYGYNVPPLVERVAPSRFFYVWAGKVEVARSPGGLEGSFDGTFEIGEGEACNTTLGQPPCAVPQTTASLSPGKSPLWLTESEPSPIGTCDRSNFMTCGTAPTRSERSWPGRRRRVVGGDRAGAALCRLRQESW